MARSRLSTEEELKSVSRGQAGGRRDPLPCELDATVFTGALALEREHPDSWRTLLTRSLQPLPDLASNPTVGDLLRAGYVETLLPTEGRSLGTVKRERALGRLLVEHVGHVRVFDIDEAMVRQLDQTLREEARPRTGEVIGAATRRRVLAMVVRLVRRARDEWGSMPAYWAEQSLFPQDRLPKRRLPPYHWIKDVFEKMPPGEGQVVVALALGCNLPEAEQKRLRLECLSWPGGRPRLWVPGRDGGERGGRWVFPPLWSWGVLLAYYVGIRENPPSSPLLPRLQVKSWRNELASVPTPSGPLRFLDLLLAHQLVALEYFLGRGLVRRSLETAGPDDPWPEQQPHLYPRARKLAQVWTDVAQPPLSGEWKGRVPRQAPPGTLLHEPELPGLSREFLEVQDSAGGRGQDASPSSPEAASGVRVERAKSLGEVSAAKRARSRMKKSPSTQPRPCHPPEAPRAQARARQKERRDVARGGAQPTVGEVRRAQGEFAPLDLDAELKKRR
jgi:hypothetical protein